MTAKDMQELTRGGIPDPCSSRFARGSQPVSIGRPGDGSGKRGMIVKDMQESTGSSIPDICSAIQIAIRTVGSYPLAARRPSDVVHSRLVTVEDVKRLS